MNSNHYETTFIIQPDLSKTEVNATIQKVKKLLKEGGAKLLYEENWGMKNLAYPIQKKTSGIYYTIQFQGSGDAIEKLESSYKIDETLLRFLTVALDKHGVAYHTGKREEAKKQKAEKATQEKNTETPKEEA